MMRLLRTILIVAIVMAFSAIPVFPGPPTGAGAQQGLRILKASPQPPKEFQEAEREAKRQIPKAREKRLTKGELERKLQIIPGEREKLQKIKQGYKPTSQTGKTGFSLSWLNPFSVPEAWASPIDVRLSYNNRFFSRSPNGNAYAVFVGVHSAYYSWYSMSLSTFGTFKGYVYFRFNAPTTGWYILDVYASGRNRATLLKSGSEIVATWDFGSSTSRWNDYVTMQYLQAGSHYFSFYPAFNKYGITKISSIRITSY